MAKGKRKSNSFILLMIILILALVFRAVLVRIIGAKGVCYYSLSNELFFMLAGAASFSIEEACASMVENRMNKQQYTNAGNVSKYAMMYSFGVGVLISLILLVLMNVLVNRFFHLHLSYMSYYFILPSIPMFVLGGSIKGYFKAVNQSSVLSVYMIIFVLVYSISGSLFGYLSSVYGQRVSLLLRNEEFAYSYGAMGASAGILLASFISLLYILLMLFLFKTRTSFNQVKEYSRIVDSPLQIIINLAATALLPFALWLIYLLVPVLNIALVFKTESQDYSLDFSFGEYYGKTFSIAGIAVFTISIFTYPYIRKAIGAIKREEYRNAREKLKAMIHRCSTIAFFTAAMLAVLADNILDTLYVSSGEQTALYLQLQALCIVFALYTVMFTEMMISMQNYGFALGIGAVAFAVHIILAIVFISTLKLSVIGVILSNLFFYAIIAFVSFVFISRTFQYTQEWFRTFAVTLIGALISALIGMLINKVISPLIGKGIAMIIVLLICTVLYIVILLALKGYQEEELETSPLGRFVLAVGRTFNLI
ncbi:MAG: polysaccharide biosynthesis C-terminal domain-containing protein [Lachnospiraceae bacterium]|nr:polysaccharide biosynthesis C-terminal domain-containing protein [Lachnospiraceae bacterium]